MGKRFEGPEATFMDMLMAYQRLGMTSLLGKPGDATVCAARFPMGEVIEFTVFPGTYTAREIEDLRTWAS